MEFRHTKYILIVLLIIGTFFNCSSSPRYKSENFNNCQQTLLLDDEIDFQIQEKENLEPISEEIIESESTKENTNQEVLLSLENECGDIFEDNQEVSSNEVMSSILLNF